MFLGECVEEIKKGVVMGYRHRVHKKVDKRIFRKTAGRIHKKNLRINPMRGGFRL